MSVEGRARTLHAPHQHGPRLAEPHGDRTGPPPLARPSKEQAAHTLGDRVPDNIRSPDIPQPVAERRHNRDGDVLGRIEQRLVKRHRIDPLANALGPGVGAAARSERRPDHSAALAVEFEQVGDDAGLDGVPHDLRVPGSLQRAAGHDHVKLLQELHRVVGRISAGGIIPHRPIDIDVFFFAPFDIVGLCPDVIAQQQDVDGRTIGRRPRSGIGRCRTRVRNRREAKPRGDQRTNRHSSTEQNATHFEHADSWFLTPDSFTSKIRASSQRQARRSNSADQSWPSPSSATMVLSALPSLLKMAQTL